MKLRQRVDSLTRIGSAGADELQGDPVAQQLVEPVDKRHVDAGGEVRQGRLAQNDGPPHRFELALHLLAPVLAAAGQSLCRAVLGHLCPVSKFRASSKREIRGRRKGNS